MQLKESSISYISNDPTMDTQTEIVTAFPIGHAPYGSQTKSEN